MNPETEYRDGLEQLASHYKDILQLLGEDPQREGLEKTPMRVAKAMQVLTRGYKMDAQKKCSLTHSSRKTTVRWL